MTFQKGHSVPQEWRARLRIAATNPSPETRERMRVSHIGKPSSRKGKHHTEEANEKNRQAHLGKKTSVETRKKLSIAQRKVVAEGRHNSWKGGVTPIHEKIRKSLEYKLWREAVFRRDNYTCQFCRKKGGRLNADHIQPFAIFPELRFAIDNGRTLCVECHKRTETYLNRWYKP